MRSQQKVKIIFCWTIKSIFLKYSAKLNLKGMDLLIRLYTAALILSFPFTRFNFNEDELQRKVSSTARLSLAKQDDLQPADF